MAGSLWEPFKVCQATDDFLAIKKQVVNKGGGFISVHPAAFSLNSYIKFFSFWQ